MYKLAEAEEMAKNANINGVAAFIKEPDTDYDRVSIQVLKESLLDAYIKTLNNPIDYHSFSDIQRIVNL